MDLKGVVQTDLKLTGKSHSTILMWREDLHAVQLDLDSLLSIAGPNRSGLWNAMRKFMRHKNTLMYVLTSETWYVEGNKPRDQYPAYFADSPERKEMVVIQAETTTRAENECYRILRDRSGKPRLGPQFTDVRWRGGDMTYLLSPKPEGPGLRARDGA